MTIKNIKAEKILPYILFGMVACFILYYVAVIIPRGVRLLHQLQRLQPSEVSSVQVKLSLNEPGMESSEEFTLTKEATARFLSLLSNVRRFAPNHPTGNWTCFVTIETTTKVPTFRFSVHSTINNGTYISLMSNWNDGWNYGDFRNNDLKAFLEEQRRAVPHETSGKQK